MTDSLGSKPAVWLWVRNCDRAVSWVRNSITWSSAWAPVLRRSVAERVPTAAPPIKAGTQPLKAVVSEAASSRVQRDFFIGFSCVVTDKGWPGILMLPEQKFKRCPAVSGRYARTARASIPFALPISAWGGYGGCSAAHRGRAGEQPVRHLRRR